MRQRKRGFKHYVLKRLLDVDPVTGCWIWLGCQSKEGYGRISRKAPPGHKGNRKGWESVAAHTYFYEFYRGPVPRGKELRHECHRRSCVNPRHISPATHFENMADWFVDYGFTAEQEEEVSRMIAADLPLSVIADRMCAPRPYITRLARTLDWRANQLDFDFTETA